MKALVQVGETESWIDPTAVVAVYKGERNMVSILFVGSPTPLSIYGVTVEDVFEALRAQPFGDFARPEHVVGSAPPEDV